MLVEVVVDGEKRALEAPVGASLGECLAAAGFLPGLPCGRGVCGKCAVQLSRGAVSTPQGAVFAPARILACQSRLTPAGATVKVEKIGENPGRKTELALPATVGGAPLARKEFVRLAPPGDADRRADAERLLAALPPQISAVPAAILPTLAQTLRAGSFAVTAVMAQNRLLAVEAGDTTRANFGLVIDVGTTTLAVYLLDVAAGRLVGAEGAPNPQRAYGADVLSRAAAGQPARLRDALLRQLAAMTKSLAARANMEAEQIYGAVVVGNSIMSHLFLGADPAGLSRSPFVPVFKNRASLSAREAGLPIHPLGRVELLANIGGHLGSDTLGVALAIGAHKASAPVLAVDIGTNGEIAIAWPKGVLAASTAAGPAFEGAHIKMGMPAMAGAIEKVDDAMRLSVIGGVPPKGLCGSGLIDAAARLLRAGILQPDGRFATAPHGPLAGRLGAGADGVREFALAAQADARVVLTQKDVRELQQAKAAIAAGIEILCARAGIELEEIEKIYLAGAFGNYLDRQSAVDIGLLPAIGLDKIEAIGNAAAAGAAMCLLDEESLAAADELAAGIEAVDLAGRDDFNGLWLKHLDFPDIHFEI